MIIEGDCAAAGAPLEPAPGQAARREHALVDAEEHWKLSLKKKNSTFFDFFLDFASIFSSSRKSFPSPLFSCLSHLL